MSAPAGKSAVQATTNYMHSNWLMAHPLYHTYPFASLFDSYYTNPWGFYFPRRGMWGYGYGYGCFFCYHPGFYSTPLTWAYGPMVGFLDSYLGVMVDPTTMDVIEGDDGLTVIYLYCYDIAIFKLLNIQEISEDDIFN